MKAAYRAMDWLTTRVAPTTARVAFAVTLALGSVVSAQDAADEPPDPETFDASRPPRQGPPGEDLQSTRILPAEISHAAGIPLDDLQILGESHIQLKYTETEVTRYKVRDRPRGSGKRLAFDATGRPVNYGQLVAAERSRRSELFGSMYPTMHRDLSELQQSVAFPALFKISVPERRLNKAVSRGIEHAMEAQRQRAAVERTAKRLFRRVLRAHGAQTVGAEPRVFGPFVVAEMPAEDLLAVARHPRVAYVGPYIDDRVEDLGACAQEACRCCWAVQGYSTPDLYDARKVTRTDLVHQYGVRGSGVRLAVMETGQIPDEYPLDCFNVVARQTANGGEEPHMAGSVAIWGNNYDEYSGTCDSFHIGYAPDAEILLANGCGGTNTSCGHGTETYEEKYEWAIDNGANIISMSWHNGAEPGDGDLHTRDIFFDYATTHWPYPTVFTSAGNQGIDIGMSTCTITPNDAFSSGKGYNFLGVANMAFDETLSDRCDDKIHQTSTWSNPTPPSYDRELPEIAAPGECHKVLDGNFGGTSAATPVAAAIAALLMDVNDDLKDWPEGVRAILLATANYQDGDDSAWKTWSDGRDGVGMVNAYYAYLTARTHESGGPLGTARYRAHHYGVMASGNFSGGFFYRTWTITNNNIHAPIRVALTWNSKTAADADGKPISSELDADLDLRLYNSNGNLVAWSSSWDGSYEFIEYAPTPADGNLTIKIRGYSIPSDLQTYYGLAWTNHYDCI